MAFEQNPVLQNLAYGTQLPQNLPQVGMNSVRQKPQGFLEGLGNFFLGEGPKQFYATPYTANQHEGFNKLLQMGLQNQENPYTGFEPIQKQIMEQFYNQILPGIAERFTGVTGGAPSSPSFAKQIGSGAQGLATMLAAHRAQFGQNQQQIGLRQAQLGLTPQYENAITPRTPGFFENLLGLAPTAIKAYGAYNNPLAYLGGQ